ncbi:MAG TPA: hypothetical protein ENI29_10890 [bacterium]|nr:hypothetical protein [bacterium]
MCYNCSDTCEIKAILKEENQSFLSKNISNNPGVKKYSTNAEKCLEFWIENSSACGTCIAACSFSKIKKIITPNEFWNNI